MIRPKRIQCKETRSGFKIAKIHIALIICHVLLLNQPLAVDSFDEENNNSLGITFTSTSSEDSFPEDNHRFKKKPLKRLRKKSEKRSKNSLIEIISSSVSNDSICEDEPSSYEDEFYSSEDENSWSTYASSSNEYEFSTSKNSLSSSSYDEDYEPSSKYHKSIDEKRKKTQCINSDYSAHSNIMTRHSKMVSTSQKSGNSKQSLYVHTNITNDVSDYELELTKDIPLAGSDPDFKLPVAIGTRIKLLANVYLANLDEMANIFLPRYTLEVECHDGSLKKAQSFFKTPKGQICVFASGGLHHIWEKNISHIFEIFFGQKIKIIRAHWIQKYLYKEKGIKRDLEEEFLGREQELHSEFYYDIYFRKFFVPDLLELLQEKFIDEPSTPILKHITVHAFSWWDVCDGCESSLSSHKPPDFAEFGLSYKIAARRRYQHDYPEDSLVSAYALPTTIDEQAWKAIWSALSRYTKKKFENDDQKNIFWTTTKDGLEICKWLGQAFRETITGLDGRSKKLKKEDILTFYKSMQPDQTHDLEELLSYLQNKNWDLSCWYRGPNFPSRIQPKWKRHWKHQVVPHFGWEEVNDFKLEELAGHCEMCGYEGLNNVFLVFHPKFHASKKFLSLPIEDQVLKERDLGFTSQSRVSDLPIPLQRKRKQSLSVGSECIKALLLTKQDLDDWRDRHTEEQTEANTNWEVERLEAYDILDNIEKNLKKTGNKKKRKRDK